MPYTDREDLNYLGELFLVGAYQTPFLNMSGGLGGQNAKVTRSFQFPVASPWSITAASQPAITEAASVSSNTATTKARINQTGYSLTTTVSTLSALTLLSSEL